MIEYEKHFSNCLAVGACHRFWLPVNICDIYLAQNFFTFKIRLIKCFFLSQIVYLQPLSIISLSIETFVLLVKVISWVRVRVRVQLELDIGGGSIYRGNNIFNPLSNKNDTILVFINPGLNLKGVQYLPAIS